MLLILFISRLTTIIFGMFLIMHYLVLILQTTGFKRWKIYNQPQPGAVKGVDPFNRGKNGDILQLDTKAIFDDWLRPGSVLYIPMGFPHETFVGQTGTLRGGPKHVAEELLSICFVFSSAETAGAIGTKGGFPADNTEPCERGHGSCPLMKVQQLRRSLRNTVEVSST